MMEKTKSESLLSRSPGLVAGVAAIVLLFVAACWWLLQPDYVALYKNMSDARQAEVISLLAQDKIPYRIGRDGSIEVLEENLNNAREHLAAAGIPSQPAAGFELFDNSDYGMSEFAQKINYQRALEGELARSIMDLREVKFARVHLTLARSDLYGSDQSHAKASVLLQLRSGMVLQDRQIAGIQELVAGSVEGLTPDTVTVIDETGQPLNAAPDSAELDAHWQIASRIESDLAGKAQDILDRVYGAGMARVSVRVQMNFDRVTSVKELPVAADGGGTGVVVKEKQTQTSGHEASGPDHPAAKEQSADEVEYVVGKNHSETETTPGRIDRISVGIVLPLALQGSNSETLFNLMTAALGLNEARGDRLSIAFLPVAATKVAATAAPVATLPRARPVVMSPTDHVPLDFYLAAAAAVLLLLLVVAAVVALRGRRPAAPSLSGEDREALLQEVRDWLAQDVREELS